MKLKNPQPISVSCVAFLEKKNPQKVIIPGSIKRVGTVYLSRTGGGCVKYQSALSCGTSQEICSQLAHTGALLFSLDIHLCSLSCCVCLVHSGDRGHAWVSSLVSFQWLQGRTSCTFSYRTTKMCFKKQTLLFGTSFKDPSALCDEFVIMQ